MLPFCEECHDVVDVNVSDVFKTKVIKGKKISYHGKEARCKECNSLIFVPEVHDHNLKMMNEEYIKAENLVMIPEIEKVLKMYNIGKRPLSLVLGWGETTLTRYLNGDIPSKQYSQTLKKIINDPEYMNELLENNKEKISESTYNSIKEAVLELLEGNYNAGSEKKINNVVKYLLYKSKDITPLALQKLLYYSQSFFKVFYNVFLFEDDCEAWVHGPVYRNVYEEYRMYSSNPIEENFEKYNFDPLSDDEKELLDVIVENFGCYSGKILEEMTHMEIPWKESRKGLSKEEPSNRIIQKDSIAKYFESVRSRHNMLNITDIRDYSVDLFEKVH